VTVSSFVPALLSKLPTFTFHASQCHSSVHGLLSHTIYLEAKFWAQGQNLEVLQSVPRCYKPSVNLYEVYAGHLISLVKVSFRVRNVPSHALDFTSLSFNHHPHS
jgi:hypothetical protein